MIGVHPDHQGKGIGSALYGTAYDELRALEPAEIRTMIREDEARGIHFAEVRGFVEEMREWESRLDVAAFDPAPWQEAQDRPVAQGIVVRTLRELEGDKDRDHKIYELENETAMDVPSGEPPIPMSYEDYRKMVLDSPNFLPEGFVVAVEEATGKYVGSSNLWRRQADSDLQTGLTAVRRDYRRKGIALAMKLRVIDYARSIHAPTIRTENATTNRPMLSINEALSFVKQPARITLVQRLAPVTVA